MSSTKQFEQSFRIPQRALLAEYALYAAVVGLGSMAYAMFSGSSFSEAVVMPALMVAALLLVYPVFSRRLWVSLSPAGVQGRTFLGGRRARVSWKEPVVLEAHTLSKGPTGVALFRLRPNGKRKLFRSLFIPDAILNSPEYRAALARYAPTQHPLSRW